ncbi:VOC family protein [Nodosilinea sp. LEGE 07088]|uniref:VOC family protein n=1 Tax=Nodosilinea sp. LEGE 07088 TaxID=2777968 RepID=UPI00188147BE|nr:VOC family protein [Nodosilinea sp. LEGE 07088]MBE9137592.1 VOC family protein [Nodosilinea sp. LEGE 07088]
MTSSTVLFHLAFPVADIPTAKEFYVQGLGCETGRETPSSLILNLYGHQLVAHTTAELAPQKGIYPRHFGLVFLAEPAWETLLYRAQDHRLTFYQGEKRRFPGTPLEHRTFFLQDPFHNLLEFKYYCHSSAIFGETEHPFVGDGE